MASVRPWNFEKSGNSLENPCPYCAAPLSLGAVFCSHCGKNLKGGEVAAAPAHVGPIGIHRGGTASWEDFKRLLIFYTLLMGCSLFFGLAHPLFSGPIGDVAFACVWGGLVIGYLITEWPGVHRAFRFRRPRAKTLLQLFFTCVAAVLFLKGYFAAFDYFKWPTIKMSEAYLKAGWPLWSLFLMVSVEPGVMEEIAFRGIILTKLSRILSRRESLVIQAALFSVLHLSPAIFVSHFVMGLLLGWVRLRTGHVYYGMLLHMSWNAFAILQELGK